MKIYIASSWRNQHAVEMLTEKLRKRDHEVLSFVENNYGEGHAYTQQMDFEEWVWTDNAKKAFEYDTKGAMKADLVIYISPSGKDASAEVGMAYASGVPIIGLYAKGEDFGLMRRMMDEWCERVSELIAAVDEWEDHISRAKLTPTDVLDIRAAYNMGWFTQSEIARAYSMSSSAISGIINRRYWDHL